MITHDRTRLTGCLSPYIEDMTYEEAKLYLEGIANYEPAPDRTAMESVLYNLHDPHKRYHAILVGGSTGKSSVSAYLAAILLEAGYRVGRFSSSTDTEYLNRFLVNGVPMTGEEYGQCLEEIQPHVNVYYARNHQVPSVFDIETMIALLFFAKDNCEFVILESGLGDARDAINIIDLPLMSILTPICLDKLESYADDLESIAANMGSIIHGAHPVILSPQDDVVRKALYTEYVYAERARMEQGLTDGNAPSSHFRMVDPAGIFVFSRDYLEQCYAYRRYELSTQMLGEYQIRNGATAVLAAETLQEMGVHITGDHVMEGISKTKLFGRFTVLDEGVCTCVLDGAQNEPGARSLAESLKLYYPDKKIIGIMGVHRQSPYKEMLAQMAPVLNGLYSVSLPNSGRSLAPEVLRAEAEDLGIHASACFTYGTAMKNATRDAGPDGVVVVFGSLTLLPAMETVWEENV